MTAKEIAELLNVTKTAVDKARGRYGRFSSTVEGLCVVCEARPVFAESSQAKKWQLCKGCYLKERERRALEEKESARVRQQVKRAKGKG